MQNVVDERSQHPSTGPKILPCHLAEGWFLAIASYYGVINSYDVETDITTLVLEDGRTEGVRTPPLIHLRTV